MGQTPEHLEAFRGQLERKIGEEVERAISASGYSQFKNDAERKRFLTGIVKAARSHVTLGFGVETRGRSPEQREKIEALQDRLEKRSTTTPGFKPAPSPVPTAKPQKISAFDGWERMTGAQRADALEAERAGLSRSLPSAGAGALPLRVHAADGEVAAVKRENRDAPEDRGDLVGGRGGARGGRSQGAAAGRRAGSDQA